MLDIKFVEEAKKKYPVGTKYKCASLHYNTTYLIEEVDNIHDRTGQGLHDCIGAYDKGFMYYNYNGENRWAEII